MSMLTSQAAVSVTSGEPAPARGPGGPNNEWSITHDGAGWGEDNRGVVLVNQAEQYPTRLQEVERALARDPRTPALWAALAHASWQAHDLETARGAWELAKVLAQPTCPHRLPENGA